MGHDARLRALGTQLGTRAAASATESSVVELWTKAAADGTGVGDCPFSHGCAMALKLKGVRFKYCPATAEGKPDWLVEAGGNLPALRDGTSVVVESMEIIKYIDAMPGVTTSVPLCSPASDAALIGTEGLMGAVGACIRAGIGDTAAAGQDLDAQLAKVEALLASSDGPWLGGSEPGAADCAVLPKLLHVQVAAQHFSHYVPPALPLLSAYVRAGLEGLAAGRPDYSPEEMLFGWSQEGAVSPGVARMALQSASPPRYADASPGRYTLQTRASEVDPNAQEHPELGFVFTDRDGNPADQQNAAVDTRVPSEGKLVIWLMAHNEELFQRLTSYGYHAIQPHYANKWFGALSDEVRDSGVDLGKIRLEAAVGENFSPHVDIPRPDSIAERSFQLIRYLATHHPEGNWHQFLNEAGNGLRWAESVILSGISHGSTTSARFAKHQEVSRVVLFSGPRDQYDEWHGFPSATSTKRFFAFTHVLDGGWPSHYHRSWKMLGLEAHGSLHSVDGSESPFANSRTLISSADVAGDANVAHTTVVPGSSARKDSYGRYIYEDVWRYMFTHPVSN